jgi:uncharacterized protein (DUF2147 family)
MRLGNLALLLTATLVGIANAHVAWAAAPQGVWLIDGEAAVQLFDCSGLLCGRLLWLQDARDSQGGPKRDKRNPDQALRHRELCGMTLIWGLHQSGPNRWDDGWFYYPDSGRTYNLKMELTGSDALVARFYRGSSFVGETKTLTRVQHGTSKGWC